MKVASTDVQVRFGEVGNACEQNDGKMCEDQTKILKCEYIKSQILLSSEFPPILIETWNTKKLCNLLVRLQQLLLEKGSLLWKLETFGILVNSK